LLEKVSYERLGTELDKIFEGNRAKQAVNLLYEFDILPLLYKFPEDSKELQSKDLVDKLIAESAEMCGFLGDLFDKFKV